MAEEQEIDTVVEDVDEDNSQVGDFAKVTATPESKTQPQSQKMVPVVVDATDSGNKSEKSSIDATAESKSSEDVAEQSKEQETVKQPKYKLREENRIPQARFNQVIRQRKIVEAQVRSLQQDHLELLDFLERFQAANPNVPLPTELATRINAKKTELQEARTKQHESRLDEAEEWLKSEMKTYSDSGLVFPSSFEKEMIAIVQAENLSSLDPAEAYKSAFKTWIDENIDSIEQEPVKTDASNQSGKPEVKPNVAKQTREAQKQKAMGVPKAKASASIPAKEENKRTSRYYATDEDPKW